MTDLATTGTEKNKKRCKSFAAAVGAAAAILQPPKEKTTMTELNHSTTKTQDLDAVALLWDHQPPVVMRRELTAIRQAAVGPISVTLYLDSHRLEYWVEVITEDGLPEQEAFHHEKQATACFDRVVKELDDVQKEPAIMLDLYIENRAAQYQER